MTIEEAMELIHGVEWRGSRPGLTRVRELLHRLGDPQDGLQFVHIAGTNGKGSTAAMLASILRAAGYTTGLFTSPYLERFSERMQVNGVPVPDAEFAAVCETLKPCITAMDDPPTEFELVTAAAMLWFRRRGCDVVVLEVGLGGRLDATNVIAAPACAVITNIGLDHTEILGDTLAQIAREKAGILKPGTCAVSYPQAPEVRRVLREICAQRGIPLTEADASAIVPLTDSVDGQTFTYRGAELGLDMAQLRYQKVDCVLAANHTQALHGGQGNGFVLILGQGDELIGLLVGDGGFYLLGFVAKQHGDSFFHIYRCASGWTRCCDIRGGGTRRGMRPGRPAILALEEPQCSYNTQM